MRIWAWGISQQLSLPFNIYKYAMKAPFSLQVAALQHSGRRGGKEPFQTLTSTPREPFPRQVHAHISLHIYACKSMYIQGETLGLEFVFWGNLITCFLVIIVMKCCFLKYLVLLKITFFIFSQFEWHSIALWADIMCCEIEMHTALTLN